MEGVVSHKWYISFKNGRHVSHYFQMEGGHFTLVSKGLTCFTLVPKSWRVVHILGVK
jgi:hypothetical protein